MTKTEDLPSIYTSLPSIPSVSPAYDPQNATLKDSDSLSSLSRLVQQGPAPYILQDYLQGEFEKEEEFGKYRERYERSKKRKREKSASIDVRGWTSAEGGDDERGKSTMMEESGEDAGRKRGRPSKKEKSERNNQVKLPKQYRTIRASDELPENFPSGSLLASLHSHSSALFTSTHSLLPPLTSTTPLLPPHLLTHFAQLQESLHAEEEALLGSLKRKGQMNEVKRGRIGRLGGGSRKGAWANAERAFESSALVAMGMLTQLLVEDALMSQHAAAQPEDCRPAAAEGGGEADPDLALPIPPVAASSNA